MCGLLIGTVNFARGAVIGGFLAFVVTPFLTCIAAKASNDRSLPYWFALMWALLVTIFAAIAQDIPSSRHKDLDRRWSQLTPQERWHYRWLDIEWTAPSLPVGLATAWITRRMLPARKNQFERDRLRYL